MRIAQDWHDYELLDCGDGERLERWGEALLIRPDPQVIWRRTKAARWDTAQARYVRSASGGGQWTFADAFPPEWTVAYPLTQAKTLVFGVKLMGFKHTGVFPEQAVNWRLLADLITRENARRGKPVSVLNLFAYTGGATLAALSAGAQVTHVDAAQGMVRRAKENALHSGLTADAVPGVRWIVDDCRKFMAREQRRGARYDIILMDPPSYGRGPGGEVWKFEDALDSLLDAAAALLSDAPLLLLLNSYTAAFSPGTMDFFLRRKLLPRLGGTVQSTEIGLPVTANGLPLPCGCTSVWRAAG